MSVFNIRCDPCLGRGSAGLPCPPSWKLASQPRISVRPERTGFRSSPEKKEICRELKSRIHCYMQVQAVASSMLSAPGAACVAVALWLLYTIVRFAR